MSHKDYTNTRLRIQDISNYLEKENSQNKSHTKISEFIVVDTMSVDISRSEVLSSTIPSQQSDLEVKVINCQIRF